MTATDTTAKWTAGADLGKIQAKRFNEALGNFSRETTTFTELTDHGAFSMRLIFGGQSHPESGTLMQAIRDKYELLVTGKNYAAIVADIEAATAHMAATRRTVDKRTTPEERAEREAAQREREEKARAEAERLATFQYHEYDTVKAAAELKRTLGIIWPSVKFSVKSERYSGGYSITPSWTDGPTEAQVREITTWFTNKHFDGMVDMESTTDPSEWNGHRFNIRGGYVHGSRSTSAELFRACSLRFAGETGCEEPTLNTSNPNYPYLERSGEPCGWLIYFHDSEHPEGTLGTDDCANWTAADLVGQLTHHKATVEPLYPLTRETVFKILLGEIGAAAPGLSNAGQNAGGVTVTQNEAKDGVEIRFDAKPDSATLDALKARGWRWSRFSKVWYHKRTPDAIAYAESLAAN